MAQRKNADPAENTDVVKVVEAQDDASVEQATEVKEKKAARVRSKKYAAVRAQVDRTKYYDAFSAMELLKRLSYTKFDGSVTADILVREGTTQVDVTLPHATGKVLRVAIATEELIAEIQAGNINFDILVASSQFVPKLAKLARILGPKGLMPNPKNGTITNNPEAKKKELESGKVTFKAEKKQPVMHITIGKVSMETQSLVENLSTIIKALENRIVRLTVSASMSPGIKIKLT